MYKAIVDYLVKEKNYSEAAVHVDNFSKYEDFRYINQYFLYYVYYREVIQAQVEVDHRVWDSCVWVKFKIIQYIFITFKEYKENRTKKGRRKPPNLDRFCKGSPPPNMLICKIISVSFTCIA